MKMKLFVAITLWFCSAAALAMDSLQIEDAWVRAMPPGAPNTAAYAILRNTSDRAVSVKSVKAEFARAIEIHESITVDGQWRMRPAPSLTIGAGQVRELRPGSFHLMVMGVNRQLQPGETVQFSLETSNGDVHEFDAEVRRGGGASQHSSH